MVATAFATPTPPLTVFAPAAIVILTSGKISNVPKLVLLGAVGTPVELDFKIGVINNYDNDRERYIKAYQDAYSALTKVPELSEWQT